MKKSLIAIVSAASAIAVHASTFEVEPATVNHDFECAAEVIYEQLGDDICLNGKAGKVVVSQPNLIVHFDDGCFQVGIRRGGVMALSTEDGSTFGFPIVQDVKLKRVACNALDK